VLRGLNRILSGQGHNQFITSAYLFIDVENYRARYSAAGHPALLLSRAGTLQRIESNGLVFADLPQFCIRRNFFEHSCVGGSPASSFVCDWVL